MKSLLFIEDTYCTSLNQLKKYFTNSRELTSSFYDEILTLQRDGTLSLWLSEGNTKEEIELSKRISNLSPNLSNTDLINSLIDILGDKKSTIKKPHFSSYFDIIDVNCYQDGALINPKWANNDEKFYKITRPYVTHKEHFFAEIHLTINIRIKKNDNESFHIKTVENVHVPIKNNKSNMHVYSEEVINLNEKHVGDIVCIKMKSFIVGEEPNIIHIVIDDEITETLNLTKTRILKIGSLSLNLAFVKGGIFQFDNSKSTYIEDFYLTETPITRDLYDNIMKREIYPDIAKKPVVNVNYMQCRCFIDKLYKITAVDFRIPTEEEWEYAAKGGNRSKSYLFSGSDRFEDVANYGLGMYDVATKKPNEIGIFDMTGLIREWCSNGEGNYVVTRGGVRLDNGQFYEVKRQEHYLNRDINLGFRLAVTAMR